jgi:hypothetical protein
MVARKNGVSSKQSYTSTNKNHLNSNISQKKQENLALLNEVMGGSVLQSSGSQGASRQQNCKSIQKKAVVSDFDRPVPAPPVGLFAIQQQALQY